MKAVPVSKMRTLVVIQSRTLAQDSTGAPVPTWSDVATVWAQVEPISGREAWLAQMVSADVSHLVTMRYYAGLGPKNRLKIGSRVLQVEWALDVENRGRQHSVGCKEVV